MAMRPSYRTAQGLYGKLPYTPLGTGDGTGIDRTKHPLMGSLSVYIPCDGAGLSFAASATSVSEWVFRNYLGNTGGTSSPNSGTLLSGYGLLDISQSDEYLRIVGSMSRGTNTGQDYSNAITYANGVLDRLSSDFPNVLWSVKGVPFNHYFLIPSSVSPPSPFGTGQYFHPAHGTGDVGRVYDWTNAPEALRQFYRDRAKAPLASLRQSWICPSGVQFFDRDLPFFRSVFDPETMYAANKECFGAAVSYADSVTKHPPVIPFAHPVHQIRRNRLFDPAGGIGITMGISANATPTDVSPEMFKHSTVQPMKDTGCDGIVMIENLAAMIVAAAGNSGQTGFGEETIGLSRRYFANRTLGGGSFDWSASHIRAQMRMSTASSIEVTVSDAADAINMNNGESCCPPPQPPCAQCKCRNSDPTDTRPLCSEVGLFDQCCTLADRCFNERINCNAGAAAQCGCAANSCRYSPGAPGGGGCPPDFVPATACAGFPNLCCYYCNISPILCACCCAPRIPEEPVGFTTRSYYPTGGASDRTNWRSLYALPNGGAYGSSTISVTKNQHFLRPWIAAGLDPLATGQYGFLSTTGAIG